MLFDLQSLWNVILQAGPQGSVIGLAVLSLVYLLGFTDLFKSGTAKRFAVVVASALFAGLQPGEVQSAVVAALAMSVSTVGKLLIDVVIAFIKARK